MAKTVVTALGSHFDSGLNQRCHVLPEKSLKKVVDKDGVERAEFLPVDTAEVIASYGTSENWSLSALLQAGVDISSGIRTGSVSRSEGANDLNDISDQVEEYFKEPEPEPKNNS